MQWFAYHFTQLLLGVGLTGANEIDEEVVALTDPQRLERLKKRLFEPTINTGTSNLRSSRSITTEGFSGPPSITPSTPRGGLSTSNHNSSNNIHARGTNRKKSFTGVNSLQSENSVTEGATARASKFPGGQEFFYRFIQALDSHMFSSHLRAALSSTVLSLTNQMIAQSSTGITENLTKAKVAAKFLGLLTFSHVASAGLNYPYPPPSAPSPYPPPIQVPTPPIDKEVSKSVNVKVYSSVREVDSDTLHEVKHTHTYTHTSADENIHSTSTIHEDKLTHKHTSTRDNIHPSNSSAVYVCEDTQVPIEPLTYAHTSTEGNIHPADRSTVYVCEDIQVPLIPCSDVQSQTSSEYSSITSNLSATLHNILDPPPPTLLLSTVHSTCTDNGLNDTTVEQDTNIHEVCNTENIDICSTHAVSTEVHAVQGENIADIGIENVMLCIPQSPVTQPPSLSPVTHTQENSMHTHIHTHEDDAVNILESEVNLCIDIDDTKCSKEEVHIHVGNEHIHVGNEHIHVGNEHIRVEKSESVSSCMNSNTSNFSDTSNPEPILNNAISSVDLVLALETLEQHTQPPSPATPVSSVNNHTDVHIDMDTHIDTDIDTHIDEENRNISCKSNEHMCENIDTTNVCIPEGTNIQENAPENCDVNRRESMVHDVFSDVYAVDKCAWAAAGSSASPSIPIHLWLRGAWQGRYLSAVVPWICEHFKVTTWDLASQLDSYYANVIGTLLLIHSSLSPHAEVDKSLPALSPAALMVTCEVESLFEEWGIAPHSSVATAIMKNVKPLPTQIQQETSTRNVVGDSGGNAVPEVKEALDDRLTLTNRLIQHCCGYVSDLIRIMEAANIPSTSTSQGPRQPRRTIIPLPISITASIHAHTHASNTYVGENSGLHGAGYQEGTFWNDSEPGSNAVTSTTEEDIIKRKLLDIFFYNFDDLKTTAEYAVRQAIKGSCDQAVSLANKNEVKRLVSLATSAPESEWETLLEEAASRAGIWASNHARELSRVSAARAVISLTPPKLNTRIGLVAAHASAKAASIGAYVRAGPSATERVKKDGREALKKLKDQRQKAKVINFT